MMSEQEVVGFDGAWYDPDRGLAYVFVDREGAWSSPVGPMAIAGACLEAADGIAGEVGRVAGAGSGDFHAIGSVGYEEAVWAARSGRAVAVGADGLGLQNAVSITLEALADREMGADRPPLFAVLQRDAGEGVAMCRDGLEALAADEVGRMAARGELPGGRGELAEAVRDVRDALGADPAVWAAVRGAVDAGVTRAREEAGRGRGDDGVRTVDFGMGVRAEAPVFQADGPDGPVMVAVLRTTYVDGGGMALMGVECEADGSGALRAVDDWGSITENVGGDQGDGLVCVNGDIDAPTLARIEGAGILTMTEGRRRSGMGSYVVAHVGPVGADAFPAVEDVEGRLRQARAARDGLGETER